MLEEHGAAFGKPYGWAAPFVPSNRPRFGDLEKSVRGKSIVPRTRSPASRFTEAEPGCLVLVPLMDTRW